MTGEVLVADQPGSLHELEKLLSMDGLPHERVPTDDFFSDYLHGLSTLAAHQGTPAESADPASGMGSGPGPSDSCGPPTASAALPTVITFSGSLASGASGIVPVTLAPRFLPAAQQSPATAAAAGWPLQYGGLVALPGQPGVMAAARAVVPLGLLGMEGKAAGKNGGRPAASNQRQATNREAQKRYRERQKARLLEMQVTIDRLHRELEHRQGVHSRNQKLEEQHYRLQAQLARVESEVEHLEWQAAQAEREHRQLARKGPSDAAADCAAPMDTQAAPRAAPAEHREAPAWGGFAPPQRQASLASSAAGSAVGAPGAGAAIADSAQGGSQRTDSLGNLPPYSVCAAQQGAHSGGAQGAALGREHSPSGPEEVAELAAAAVADPLAGMYGPPPAHEEFDSLLGRFQAQVAKVKRFLEEHQLRLRDPSAVVLPPALRGQVLVLVQESLGICRDLLRVEGVDVIELLQRQDEQAMASSGALPGSMLRQKWLHVIQVLHLTAEQRQQLLLQRTAHLTLMRRIYQQRQQLNMQAMSLMLLPGGGAATGAAASTADSRATSGAQAAKLAAVLRLVKENLRREQRASMEINACTLSRILTPVQAALYMCEAFPLHCDALGMCLAAATCCPRWGLPLARPPARQAAQARLATAAHPLPARWARHDGREQPLTGCSGGWRNALPCCGQAMLQKGLRPEQVKRDARWLALLSIPPGLILPGASTVLGRRQPPLHERCPLLLFYNDFCTVPTLHCVILIPYESIWLKRWCLCTTTSRLCHTPSLPPTHFFLLCRLTCPFPFNLPSFIITAPSSGPLLPPGAHSGSKFPSSSLKFCVYHCCPQVCLPSSSPRLNAARTQRPMVALVLLACMHESCLSIVSSTLR
ncbi:hypothetical protein ABPG75_010788 [Micractinium tetrahymenae]